MTEQRGPAAGDAPEATDATLRATQGEKPSPRTLGKFLATLPVERRLRPVADLPRQNVEVSSRLSWLDVVTGESYCTEDERATVITALQTAAVAVLTRHSQYVKRLVSGIMSSYEVHPLLHREIPGIFSPERYRAFMRYISLDHPDFYFLPDGRIVLVRRFRGNIKDIPKLIPIDNMLDVLTRAVDRLLHNCPRPNFDADLAAAALELAGYSVTPEQRDHLPVTLLSVPGVEVLGRGIYRYNRPLGLGNPKDPLRQQLAKAGIRGLRHKPRRVRP